MDLTCSICLSDIDMSDKYTLSCEHMLHKSCMFEYREATMSQNKFLIECPICNQIDTNMISYKLNNKFNNNDEIQDLLKQIHHQIYINSKDIAEQYTICDMRIINTIYSDSEDDQSSEQYIHDEQVVYDYGDDDELRQINNERIMDLIDQIEYASI